ncbi:MAG: AAA family ATPase [Planctomycetes bacterium]|nr:AAA family ATPase [Planctomycetota bacterium]
MTRPLFSKKIAELEQLFEEWRNSPADLAALADELAHRKTSKAVALLDKVKAAMSKGAAPQSSTRAAPEATSGAATQQRLWPEAAPAADSAPFAQHPPRAHREQPRAARPQYETFVPPDEFTLVQPMGVRPRPSAFRFTLNRDLSLDIPPTAPPAARFRIALAALIAEMRRRQVGRQQFVLEDGRRVATEAKGFSYDFEFSEDANIFEGAKVELVVGGQVEPGYLTAILMGRIIVTLQEDFGEHIHTCILRIDNTALLQALHDRLASIERGEVSGFRADFAASVLRNAVTEHPPASGVTWPWRIPPTAQQQRFVELALTNDLSWLWGPPGTGKTAVLSALTRLLYERGKRVLICSNTNRAVDQLIHKLCRNLRETNDPALEDGRVLRVGRIEDELRKEFGEFITPDRVVERRSRELADRKAEIEAELERLGREVAYSQGLLRRFAESDAASGAYTSWIQRVEGAKHTLAECHAALKAARSRHAKLLHELQDFEAAGFLRRLLMRDEVSIRQDIARQEARITAAAAAIQPSEEGIAVAQTTLQEAATHLRALEDELRGEDRAQTQRVVDDYAAKQGPLRQELSDIAAKLEEILNAVLREARIVGATVTRTFLRPVEFSEFDTVIIDEASMILLPAVFQAAGLATQRVVIAGDFQQLPPIVQTEQQCIHDVLAHNVFEEAGISFQTVFLPEGPARLIMLDEQFRMDPSLCDIVSHAFYKGALKTHSRHAAIAFSEPDPLSHRLTVVDTSRVWPFTTRDAFRSRLNLIHALAVRNLVLHLKEHGRLYDNGGRSRVGICTPYAAQAKLLRDIFKAHTLDGAPPRASTVHGFQGDERSIMVLDLVDSVGERNAGIFLQANQLVDSGAKLMNVALSRAQHGLVIVANLTFLDQKLPSDAILRGLLHDIQRMGQIVDVTDVLSLRPFLDDLKTFGAQPEIDPEALRTGLFRGKDFTRLCRHDMEAASKSIVVFSAFITPERAAQMGEVFRRKIGEGIKVRCVTRPPDRNGSIPEELGRAALMALEAIGVAIDLRSAIHEKVVLIDNRIAWFGSLNPLSHTPHTSELMARVVDPGLALHIARVLSVRRRSDEEWERGAAAEAENPRCEKCGGWSVLVHGKFGPFFRCVNHDGWTQNVDAAKRRKTKATARNAK